MDYLAYAPALGLTVVLGILLILRYRPKGVIRPVTTKGPLVFEKVTLCLTEADQLFFIRQRKKLADLGFVDVGDFSLVGRTPKGIYRAMVHREAPIYAVLSQILAKKPQQYLTFYTLLPEGIPLATDNQEVPDRGGHPRLQRLPGASVKETFSHHETCLKEIQDGGIQARETRREGFYQDYAEILIVNNLTSKGSLRHGDIAKELEKLPALNVAKMLKPLHQVEKVVPQQEPQPEPVVEKKALSKELSLIKERKEKPTPEISISPEPPEQATTLASVEIQAPVSDVTTVPLPPFAESIGEETLIRFDDIPVDAAAFLPFAINEVEPEFKPEEKSEAKPEPVQEAPKPETPPEAKPDEKKPSRLKAPDKCPACGEPVLSPLSSYCRKCKAYLRG